jgi:hypothetical protein
MFLPPFNFQVILIRLPGYFSLLQGFNYRTTNLSGMSTIGEFTVL